MTRIPSCRPLPRRALLAAIVLIAGCDRSAETDQASQASVEVLPGSASDAMIQLDRSQAQAPFATPQGGEASPGTTSASAGEKSSGDAAPTPPPAPTASPEREAGSAAAADADAGE